MGRSPHKRHHLNAAIAHIIDRDRSPQRSVFTTSFCVAACVLALGAPINALADSVAFSPISYEFDEGDGTANVTVSLTGTADAYGGSCTVQGNLLAVSRSATAGQDFTLGSQSVSFNYTQPSSNPVRLTENVPVTIIDDFTLEGDEEFDIQLRDISVSGPGCTASINRSPAPARVTIRDNDAGSVTAGFVAESTTVDENTGNATVAVELSGPDIGNASCNVAVSTRNGSAQSGEDFSPVSQTLVFSGGQRRQNVSIPIVDDTRPELQENLTVNIDSATCQVDGGTVGIGTGRTETTVNIRDNDVTGLTLDPSLVAVQGSPGTLTSRTLTVSGGVPPYRISVANANASVTPATLSDSGDFTYGLQIQDGTTGVVDTITVVDARGVSAESVVARDILSGIPGLTPPQQEIARALDTLCPQLEETADTRPLSPEEQDLLEQCRALFDAGINAPQTAAEGIAAITPDQTNAPTRLLRVLKDAQDTNLQQRLLWLRNRARGGFSADNLTVNLNGRAVPLHMIAQLFSDQANGGGAGADTPDDGRLGAFISGNLNLGDRDDSSNETGFDFETAGLTAGLDYRFTDDAIFGVALGYAKTDLDFNQDRGNLDVSGWSASVYGNYFLGEKFYLDGTFTYSWDDYDQLRNVSYSLLESPRNAVADFDGSGYSLSLGGGYEDYEGPFSYGLYGRVLYSDSEIDGYRETGAAGLDMDIHSRDVDSLRSTLGGRVGRVFSTSGGVWIPQLFLEWEHQFEDGGETLNGTFANDPSGTLFRLPTDTLEGDYFRLGLSVTGQFTHGRSAYLNYETTVGQSDSTEHNFSLGVRLEF